MLVAEVSRGTGEFRSSGPNFCVPDRVCRNVALPV